MSLLSLFLKPTHNLHTLTNTPIIRDNNIRKKLFLLSSIGSLENNKFENRFHFVPSYPVLHQRWKREQNVSVEEGQQWCCCFWRGTREEHLERQPFNPSVSITRIPDSWRNNAAWNCLVWINFVRQHVNTHARAIGAWIRNLIWMPALRLEGLLRRYSCGLNVRATWNFPPPPPRKLLYRTSIYRVSRAPCN